MFRQKKGELPPRDVYKRQPQEDEFAYCKVECENGRVQSNIISKYSKVNYYLNADNQIEDELSLIHIWLAKARGKLKEALAD